MFGHVIQRCSLLMLTLLMPMMRRILWQLNLFNWFSQDGVSRHRAHEVPHMACAPRSHTIAFGDRPEGNLSAQLFVVKHLSVLGLWALSAAVKVRLSASSGLRPALSQQSSFLSAGRNRLDARSDTCAGLSKHMQCEKTKIFIYIYIYTNIEHIEYVCIRYIHSLTKLCLKGSC